MLLVLPEWGLPEVVFSLLLGVVLVSAASAFLPAASILQWRATLVPALACFAVAGRFDVLGVVAMIVLACFALFGNPGSPFDVATALRWNMYCPARVLFCLLLCLLEVALFLP